MWWNIQHSSHLDPIRDLLHLAPRLHPDGHLHRGHGAVDPPPLHPLHHRQERRLAPGRGAQVRRVLRRQQVDTRQLLIDSRECLHYSGGSTQQTLCSAAPALCPQPPPTWSPWSRSRRTGPLSVRRTLTSLSNNRRYAAIPETSTRPTSGRLFQKIIWTIFVKPKSNSKSQILVPNPSPKSKSQIRVTYLSPKN